MSFLFAAEHDLEGGALREIAVSKMGPPNHEVFLCAAPSWHQIRRYCGRAIHLSRCWSPSDKAAPILLGAPLALIEVR